MDLYGLLYISMIYTDYTAYRRTNDGNKVQIDIILPLCFSIMFRNANARRIAATEENFSLRVSGGGSNDKGKIVRFSDTIGFPSTLPTSCSSIQKPAAC